MTSSPTRSGRDLSSAMCTPQTGSRTNRREPVTVRWLLRVPGAVSRAADPNELSQRRSIQDTTRRNIARTQNSTTSQIKNRINREENALGVVSPAVIVCKGKRSSQTKSSDFNSLRRDKEGNEAFCPGRKYGNPLVLCNLRVLATSVRSQPKHSRAEKLKVQEFGRCPCRAAIRLE